MAANVVGFTGAAAQKDLLQSFSMAGHEQPIDRDWAVGFTTEDTEDIEGVEDGELSQSSRQASRREGSADVRWLPSDSLKVELQPQRSVEGAPKLHRCKC